MTDKPKTLADELMELAEWIEREGHLWQRYFGDKGLESNAAQAYGIKVAEVRTMAERVKGTANLKVTTHQFGKGMGSWCAWIRPTPMGKGNTEDEALAHLQSLLDQQK